MIKLTSQLGDALLSSKHQIHVADGMAFRLIGTTEGRVEFSVDQPGETDEKVVYSGEPVLYVSSGARNILGEDRLIDVRSTPEGLQIVAVEASGVRSAGSPGAASQTGVPKRTTG